MSGVRSRTGRRGWHVTPFGAVFLVLLAACVGVALLASGSVETTAFGAAAILLLLGAGNGIAGLGSGPTTFTGETGTARTDRVNDRRRVAFFRGLYRPRSRGRADNT